MNQRLQTCVVVSVIVEFKYDRQVLGQLLQAVDIFLYVLWGTVVVVQDSENAVNEIVVCDAKAMVDGEGEMDQVVQEEVQGSLDQLAERLRSLVLSR